jgi:hypothetical protein
MHRLRAWRPRRPALAGADEPGLRCSTLPPDRPAAPRPRPGKVRTHLEVGMAVPIASIGIMLALVLILTVVERRERRTRDRIERAPGHRHGDIRLEAYFRARACNAIEACRHAQPGRHDPRPGAMRPRLPALAPTRATRPGHGGTRERVAAVGAYPCERAKMRGPAPPVRAGPRERSARDWRWQAGAQTRGYAAGSTESRRRLEGRTAVAMMADADGGHPRPSGPSARSLAAAERLGRRYDPGAGHRPLAATQRHGSEPLCAGASTSCSR